MPDTIGDKMSIHRESGKLLEKSITWRDVIRRDILREYVTVNMVIIKPDNSHVGDYKDIAEYLSLNWCDFREFYGEYLKDSDSTLFDELFQAQPDKFVEYIHSVFGNRRYVIG